MILRIGRTAVSVDTGLDQMLSNTQLVSGKAQDFHLYVLNILPCVTVKHQLSFTHMTNLLQVKAACQIPCCRKLPSPASRELPAVRQKIGALNKG